MTQISGRSSQFAILALLLWLNVPVHAAAQVERLPPLSQFAVPTALMHPLWDAPVDGGGEPLATPEDPGNIVDAPFEATSEEQVGFFFPDGSYLDSLNRANWYNPLTWFFPECWDTSFEFGLNAANGNANSFNILTGMDLTRETKFSTWDVDILYSKNTSNGVELQHNALAFSNWDWKLPVDRWSVFWKSGLEYDEFRNFDLRFNTNTGVGYAFVDSENKENLLRGRFGSGASREFGGDDEIWRPEANFGWDLKRQLTKRQKLSGQFDYYPNWTAFADFRLVGDLGWEVQIDEADNLSLKVSMIDRYDSTPNGARPNDVNYAVLVIWTL